MNNKEMTLKAVKEFGKSANDTGSAGVQVALLTNRINHLMEHFKVNEHDYNSNRGLLKLIGQRKSHLRYLQLTNPEEYNKVIKKLNIRK